MQSRLVVAFWSSLCCLASLAAPRGVAFAQPPADEAQPAEDGAAESGIGLFGEPDRATLRVLHIARQFVERGNYTEGVRLLVDEVLEKPGDFFFRPDASGNVYSSIKAEARRLLAALPEEGLKEFSARYGATADRLLAEATATGDLDGLWAVARNYFPLDAAQTATWLLAQHHYDRGHAFAAATLCERLLNDAGAKDRFGLELPLLAALSWRKAGMAEQAETALAQLERDWPDASVEINEDKALLVEPARLVEQVASTVAGGQSSGGERRVLGGDLARSAAAVDSPPLLRGSWTNAESASASHLRIGDQSLLAALRRGRTALVEQAKTPLPALRAIAVGDRVIFRDWRDLSAVDHQSGKLAWRAGFHDPQASFSLDADSSRLAEELARRVFEDANYASLSSDGQRVFVTEDEGLETAGGGALPPLSSGLVVLPPGVERTHNRLAAYSVKSGKLLWRRTLTQESDSLAARPEEVVSPVVDRKDGPVADPNAPQAAPATSVFFLGAPLPLAGKLYVIGDRGGEINLYVLDAESGRVEHRQRLVNFDDHDAARDLRRRSGASPAFAAGVLVCPTSCGAVVALDLTTQSLLWGYKYDNNVQAPQLENFGGPQNQEQPKDQNRWRGEIVRIAEGRVYLTPPESEDIHCLDLLTGRQHWRTAREDGLYLGCVHGGKAVVVGHTQLRAYRSGSGELAWKSPLPSGAKPAGLGYFGGARLYLPLDSAKIAAVDLASGAIDERVAAAADVAPGNLLVYHGAAYSLAPDALARFDLRAALEQRLTELTGTSPEAAETLLLKGDLALEDGRLDEAVLDLTAAHAQQDDAATRRRLLDALTLGLSRDFSRYAPRLEEARGLARAPEEQARLLSVLADGLEAGGDHAGALEALLALTALDIDQLEHKPLADGVTARRDAWIRARFEELRTAEDDAAAALTTALEERLSSGTQDAAALRRIIDYFPNHALARQARLKLARLRALDVSPRHEALLRELASADDAETAAAGAALLAEFYLRAEMPRAAAEQYRRLAGEFAELKAAGDQTGQQLVASLAEDSTARRLAAAPPWPSGKVESRRAAGFSSFGFPLAVANDPSSRPALLMSQQTVALEGFDGEGRRFSVNLEPAQQGFFGYYPFNQAWQFGNLLIVSNAVRLYAVDLLGSPEVDAESRGPRLLWKRSLLDLGPLGRVQSVGTSGTSLPWGGQRTRGSLNGQTPDSFAAVDGELLLLGRKTVLHAVDPQTGDTLWTRAGITPGTELFGGRRFVYAVPQNQTKALVLDRFSGRKLGEREVPHDNSRMACINGNLLIWDGGASKLRLFDPWAQKDLWSAPLGQNAKASFIDERELAVFDSVREGADDVSRFRVFSLADGKELLNKGGFLPFAGLNQLFAFRHTSGDSTRYVAVATRAYGQTGEVQYYPVHGSWNETPVLDGSAYGFDAKTGAIMWQTRVKDTALVSSQPADAPALVLAAYKNHHDTKTNVYTRELHVLALDKQTGQERLTQVSNDNTQALLVTSNPLEHEMDIVAQPFGLKLTWTGQEEEPK